MFSVRNLPDGTAPAPGPRSGLPAFSDWAVMIAVGVMAGLLLLTREPETDHALDVEEASPPGAAKLVRGAHPASSSSPHARGWKAGFRQIYDGISEHRILALAAGMTFYSLLAIFPALAALVESTACSLIPRASRDTWTRCPGSCRVAR